MKKIMFNDRYGLTQAVLDGRKTMTRRIPKIQRPSNDWEIAFPVFENSSKYDSIEEMELKCPLYRSYCWLNKNGDHTEWIKPSYRVGEKVAIAQKYYETFKGTEMDLEYLKFSYTEGWNNKMFVKAEFMPNRIKITDVRIELLQDISDEDCLREGIQEDFKGVKYSFDSNIVFCNQYPYDTPREAFAALIDKVSGKGTWESNPYVFVYEFELIK